MSNTEKPKSFGYRFVGFVRTVFVYVVALGIIVAALIFAADKSPQKSVFGYRYYTVLTPSMEPNYSVGDVVLVKLANAEDIEVGDVITFNPSNDNDTYLTHRVTEKLEDYDGTGVTCFRTKGDANESEDSFLIDSSRVIGTVSVGIPKVGYIIRFVQLKWYIVIPLVIMIFVLFRLLKIYFTPESEQEAAENTAPAENVN
jgi:signal peptidase